MRRLPLFPDPPTPPLAEPGHRDVDPGCTACALHEGVRTPCLAPEGEAGGLLVVMGAPFEDEDRHARPLVGSTGQLVRQLVAKHWAGKVAFDYGVKCAPGVRKVGDAHYAACRPFLRATLRDSAPERVLAFGSAGARAVMGRYLDDHSTRGGYAYLGQHGPPTFFLPDPTEALRNRIVRGWLEEDVERAINRPLPPRPPIDGEVLVVETYEDARDAIFDVYASGRGAYDVETFGGFADGVRLLCLAVAPAGAHHAYLWRWAQMNDPQVGAPLGAWLQDPRAPKGAQNGKFDQLMIRGALGIRVQGVVADTRLGRKILDANAESKLETQQVLVGMAGGKDDVKPWVDAGSRQLNKLADDPGAPIDMSAWDASELEMRLAIKRVGDGVNPKRYAYAAIPADLRDSYCGRDAVSTSMLLDLQASQLAAEPELAAHYRGIVMPLSDAFVEMEAAGVAVSMANLGALRTFLVSEEARLLARLKAYGDFNPNTPKEVAELLYDKLGLPCLRTTPKGGRSTDVEALADLKHPAADDILEYRRAVKYRSTYADSYLAAVRPDGRVHPSILPDGTATGRPSCQDPNLFNVPTAKKELGTMVRDCFVARSGHVLVEADYSQIELRIAAMLSGDELMVDFFKRDVDFHLETAIMIAPLLGVDPSEVTKEHKLRGDAKTVNFATLYGDSPAGLAMKLKTTKQKAAALQNAILGKFRKLKAWIDMMLAEARRTGRCRTWWAGRNARIRPLIDIASPARELRETAERSSWNTPIQGTAAEFTNASIVELTRRLAGRRARLILTVYDSILAEVEEGWVEGYRAVARDVMLGWDSRGVPLEVEVKAGKTWGQMEVLKP